jgi:hypothetical protein
LLSGISHTRAADATATAAHRVTQHRTGRRNRNTWSMSAEATRNTRASTRYAGRCRRSTGSRPTPSPF